jgi:hypothetical protein
MMLSLSSGTMMSSGTNSLPQQACSLPFTTKEITARQLSPRGSIGKSVADLIISNGTVTGFGPPLMHFFVYDGRENLMLQ